MKSTKTISELDCMATSTMRFLEGEEVEANLDWEGRWFYVWLEPTWNFIDFCEEVGGSMMAQLERLNIDLVKMGVQQFYDLASVNEWLKQWCGDNEPAEFYLDDWGWICGA